MSDEGIWREDIDSLAFRPEGHNGLCVVHRLAFRALVGARLSPEICLAYFRENRARFNDAARAKASLKGLTPHSNFHLTSRDLRRAPTETA